MNKSQIFWGAYKNLEESVIEVSKFIYITDEKIVNGKEGVIIERCNTQLETFSPYIADLLVQVCVQIEAISKELYFENGGEKPSEENSLHFDEDCLKKIDMKWQTSKKVVLVVSPSFNLSSTENNVLRPLRNAHKRQGTDWEKAYQAVKHDRINSMYKGNVKVLIHAMAALYLLNLYYRKDEWVTSINDLKMQDYSQGSSLFAVKAPTIEQPWYDNKPIIDSDSPYVACYGLDDFNKIQSIQGKESQLLNDYWVKQPELKEPEFISQLIEAQKTNSRVMKIWELAKYRLNKKIPKDLPFEERKKLLINSEEWNGWIHQNNDHLKAEDISENNIQDEINTVGELWGIELEQRFVKNEWVPYAINKNILRVYIP